jgi:sortase A
VIDFLRTRRWARRVLSGGSAGLLILAVVLLGFPVYTNWVHNRLQGHLGKQLASPALKDAYRNHALREGDSLTRLRIPKLGVDVVVVEGTSESALRAGAGHYPETPLPCDVGNVSIAGHRTTYGKPFANIDQLTPGDQITLDTPIGSCTYQVSAPPPHLPTAGPAAFVVLPTDRWVVANDAAQHALTLTSCHPKGSASHRVIIKALMVSSTPA